jgi:hypothetical protein
VRAQAKKPAKAPAKAPARSRAKQEAKVITTVGLPPDKLKALDRAAARETRSRNNLIEAWLTEMLEQKGYLPRPEDQ